MSANLSYLNLFFRGKSSRITSYLLM